MTKKRFLAKVRPRASTYPRSSGLSEETKSAHLSVGAWLKLNWQHAKGGGRFPWNATPFERFRRWLLSPKFQLALQLGLGLLWTGIFTVVKKITFNEACLATIFVVAALSLLSPDTTMGSQLQAAYFILFAAAYCLPYAGSIVSLARTPGSAFTGTLIVFALIAFIPIAFLRASPGNPGAGLIIGLMFGIGCLDGVAAWPARVLWHEVIAFLMAGMCLSASGTILVSTLVLPNLAGDRLRETLASVLVGLGHQLSAQASTLLASCEDSEGASKPEENSGKAQSAQARRGTEAWSNNLRQQMLLPEERESTESFLKILRNRTDPNQPGGEPPRMHPHPSIQALRGSLVKSSALLARAEFEPAFLQAGPQDTGKWAAVIRDVRSLLTRIGALHLLIEGGQILHSSIFLEMCFHDPLPSLKLVLAELACACCSLGKAVEAAGTNRAEQLCTSVPWQSIRNELADCIDKTNAGYWERHRKTAGPLKIDTPEALEVRVILFLVTLIQGIIDALAAVEASLPAALGISDCSSFTKLSDLHIMHFPEEKPSAEGRSSTNGSFRDGNGNGAPQLSSPEKASSDKGELALEIDGPEPKAASRGSSQTLKDLMLVHTHFLYKAVRLISGIDSAKRLKVAFWDESIRTFSSKKELMVTLRSRRVHFGFRFWLAACGILTIAICLESDFKSTRKWRVYYAYITTLIVCIERVEAAAWKITQRVIGTLLGGALGYLIMLRVYIHTRGSAVLALVCASAFVISQGLHTSFRYAAFLTILTMTSLTICHYSTCCMRDDDFYLWLARTVNIIVGCAYAMGISLFVLPWYTSDEHLELLAGGFKAAGDLAADLYDSFHDLCKAVDKESAEKRCPGFSAQLEATVVRPVEAVLLGLQTDTVFWSKGLFSTPPVVLRLTAEMRGLVQRLAALELAVIQSPGLYGSLSATIYDTYIAPLDKPNRNLCAALKRLTQSCQPILDLGWTPERAAEVQTAYDEVEHCRVELKGKFEESRKAEHASAVSGTEVSGGVKTAADSVKLNSWLVAICKVYDQMMLISRIVMHEGCAEREDRLSAFFSLSWGQEEGHHFFSHHH